MAVYYTGSTAPADARLNVSLAPDTEPRAVTRRWNDRGPLAPINRAKRERFKIID